MQLQPSHWTSGLAASVHRIARAVTLRPHEPPAEPARAARPTGPGHAPGHRHLGPPPEVPTPRTADPKRPHDQPWVPTGGLTDKERRSQRRG